MIIYLVWAVVAILFYGLFPYDKQINALFRLLAALLWPVTLIGGLVFYFKARNAN